MVVYVFTIGSVSAEDEANILIKRNTITQTPGKKQPTFLKNKQHTKQ